MTTCEGGRSLAHPFGGSGKPGKPASTVERNKGVRPNHLQPPPGRPSQLGQQQQQTTTPSNQGPENKESCCFQ